MGFVLAKNKNCTIFASKEIFGKIEIMGKVIAVSNHKGGVGKTTSTVNIGAGLSFLKKKVLLIDLDPQSNLSQSLGVEDAKRNIYGAIKGEHELEIQHVLTNLDLVPSSLDLSGVEMELSHEPGREYILDELLEPIRDKYDYILIDCPPSLGLLTLNALATADEIYIPLQAHYLALKGLTKITQVIEKVRKRLNRKLKIGGVFITQFDKRKILNRDVAAAIQDYFDDQVFNTKIRDNITLAEAPSKGIDIFRYSPKSYGAKDYLNLCIEITDNDN